MKLRNCNNGDYIWLQVQNNQTLQEIAMLYGVDKRNIIRNNPNIELYEGEVVKIVRKTANFHTVKPMETVNSICEKYNLKVEDLIRLNNLNSKRLFIGQSLKIQD